VLLEHAGELKHFKPLTVSGSYWLGAEHRDRRQRIC